MDSFWVSFAEIVKNWTTTLAVIAAGAWAYFRFGMRRERETALGIELDCKSVPYNGGNHLVWFDVTLANKGAVRVDAKRKLRPAYRDQFEMLAYSGDLLVCRVPTSVSDGGQVRWFSSPYVQSPTAGDIEADLLDEYAQRGVSDFWMEPNETYHVATAIVLAPGNYIAMITFVGNRGDHEFWRRLFLVEVPVPSSPVASGSPLKTA